MKRLCWCIFSKDPFSRIGFKDYQEWKSRNISHLGVENCSQWKNGMKTFAKEKYHHDDANWGYIWIHFSPLNLRVGFPKGIEHYSFHFRLTFQESNETIKSIETGNSKTKTNTCLHIFTLLSHNIACPRSLTAWILIENILSSWSKW